MATLTTERRLCGKRLRTLRFLRKFSQSELAQKSAVATSMISRLEQGVRQPGPDVLAALAQALEVEPHLLLEELRYEAQGEEVHFRHRARTPAWARNEALGHTSLLCELVDFFDTNLGIPPLRVASAPQGLDGESIERTAGEMRKIIGVPNDRPLASVVEALEAAGVPVVLSPGTHVEVDAFSVHRNERPVIILNQKDSGSRVNFTGAHELGHLVLHQGIETGDQETESQANRFSSAFLLPAEAFSKEFPRLPGDGINWDGLIRMKARWRVGLQAMVRRAYDLRIISAVAYRRASQYASSKGWRRAIPGEPGEFPAETPHLLRECFEAAEKHRLLTPIHVAERLGWDIGLLRQIACMNDLGVELPNWLAAHLENVIPLTVKSRK